jgi:hypothetical protein
VKSITPPIIAIDILVAGTAKDDRPGDVGIRGTSPGRFTDRQEDLWKDSRNREFSERVFGQDSEERFKISDSRPISFLLSFLSSVELCFRPLHPIARAIGKGRKMKNLA